MRHRSTPGSTRMLGATDGDGAGGRGAMTLPSTAASSPARLARSLWRAWRRGLAPGAIAEVRLQMGAQ